MAAKPRISSSRCVAHRIDVPSRGDLRDELPDPPGAVGIEVVRRLVDEEQRRVDDQRSSGRQPLLHPVRVEADARRAASGRARPARAGHPARRPASRREDPCSRPKKSRFSPAREAEVEGSIAGRDEPDSALHDREPFGARIETGMLIVAGRRRNQSREDTDRRRLPGSVGAEQCVDRPASRRNDRLFSTSREPKVFETPRKWATVLLSGDSSMKSASLASFSDAAKAPTSRLASVREG